MSNSCSILTSPLTISHSQAPMAERFLTAHAFFGKTPYPNKTAIDGATGRTQGRAENISKAHAGPFIKCKCPAKKSDPLESHSSRAEPRSVSKPPCSQHERAHARSRCYFFFLYCGHVSCHDLRCATERARVCSRETPPSEDTGSPWIRARSLRCSFLFLFWVLAGIPLRLPNFDLCVPVSAADARESTNYLSQPFYIQVKPDIYSIALSFVSLPHPITPPPPTYLLLHGDVAQIKLTANLKSHAQPNEPARKPSLAAYREPRSKAIIASRLT